MAPQVARTAGLVGCPNVVHVAASRLGRTFSGQGAGGHAGPGMLRAGWRGSKPLRTTEQHPAPFRAHPPKASAVTLSETCDASLSHLTTPHKLQGRGSVGKPIPSWEGRLRP